MNIDPTCLSSEKYRREHLPTANDIIYTRREFLERTGMGFGAMSLASILGLSFGGPASADPAAGKAPSPLAPKAPPLPAKAKAVIHIFASGGPSHVDTWDPKPELAKYADKTLPGLDGLAFPSPFKFAKKAQSGIEVSEVFPKLGERVDDMAIARSLLTASRAHEAARRGT